MTTRYCARCDAEVEDTGGFCLLGHLLRSAPLLPTIGELRGDPGPDGADGILGPVRHETEAPRRVPEPELVMAAGGREPAASPAEPPRPPASEETVEPDAMPAESSRYGLWDTLFSPGPARIVASDPIAGFAADGRINWGPRRRYFPGRRWRRELA